MKSAPKPDNEKERLEALYRYCILNTPPEAAFDELTKLAVDICNVPVATITLVDEDREWYKSKVGITDEEAPRNISFCAHTILGRELFIVPDTLKDDRFSDNPFVTDNPPLRFYAAFPLIMENGHAIGTLCVIDHVPRRLNKYQKKSLQTLATHIVTLLESRRKSRELLELDKKNKQLDFALSEAESRYQVLVEKMNDAMFVQDENGKLTFVNNRACELSGYTKEELIGNTVTSLFDKENKDVFMEQMKLRKKGGTNQYEICITHKDGHAVYTHISPQVIVDENGIFKGSFAVVTDITKRIQLEKELEKRIENNLEELHKSEENFAKAIEVSPDSITISRLSDGKLLQVNQGFTRLSGYSKVEALRKNTMALNIWANPGERQTFVQSLIENGSVIDQEVEFVKKNGEHIYAIVSAVLQEIDGEKCLFSITRDISERKRSEEKLRISEQQFRLAMEYSPIGLALVATDGRWLAVNNQLLHITGYSKEELLARDFQSITHPDDLDKDLLQVQKMLDGEIDTYEMEKRYIHKNGQIVWIQLNVSLVRDNKNRPLYFISQIQDITERKETQNLLQDSEEKFHKAFNSSPDLMVINRLADGRLIEVNSTFEKSLGYSREEAIGKTPVELGIWVDPARRDLFSELLRKNNRVQNFEIVVRTKNGNIRIHRLSAELFNYHDEVCIVSVGQDITEQKQQEELLRLQDRALESATNPILIVDANQDDFPIIYCNAAFEKVTGYTKQEVLGKNPRFLQGNDRNQPQLKGIRKALKVGSEARVLLRNYRKDGTLYWNELHLAPVRDENENITHWLGVHNDITDLKNIENDLLLKTAAFEMASDGLILTDALQADNPIIYVNKGFLDFTGYSEAEVLGNNCRFLQGPESDPKTIKNIRKAIKQGKSFQGEIINYRKDGNPFWNLLRIEPYYNHEGNLTHFVGSQTDITKRKMTEKALADSEDKFSKAFRSLPDPLTISRIEDGVIVDANDSCLEISGYSRNELIGKSVFELGVWKNLEKRKEIIQELLTKGKLINFEADFVKKTGEIVHCLLSAEIIKIEDREHTLMLFKDITQQKKAEFALQSSEKLLRFLYEENPSMYFILSADGVVLSVNQFGARSLGYTIKELTGKNILKVFPPKYHQYVLSNMNKCIGNPGVIQEWETQKITKDGRSIWVRESGMFTKSPDGKEVILINCRDITANKIAQDNLRSSEAMLSEAQHVAQLGSWELDIVNNNLSWSDQVYEMFEIKKEQFGASYEAFLNAIHPEDRDMVNKAYTESLKNKSPYEIEHRLLMKNGSIKFVKEKCVTYFDNNGSPLRSFGTVMDITDMKLTQQELEERARQQNFIAGLGQLAISESDITIIFEKAVRGLAEILHVEYTKILELQPDKNKLLLRYGHGWEKGLVNNIEIDTGLNSQAGYTLRQETPVIVDDLTRETRFHGPDLLLNHHVISGVSVLIKERDVPYGVLGIHTTKHRHFSRYDIEFIQSIANVLANVIRNKDYADIILKSRERLRNLAASLQHVREEERKSIAQEIHDELGQRLTAIQMDLSWTYDHLPKQFKDLSSRIASMIALTDSTLDITRQMALELRPAMLDDLGLEATIEWTVQEFSKYSKLDFDLNIDNQYAVLNSDRNRDIVIYRVLQESLTNVARHAYASHIEISLKVLDSKIYLVISDDGIGIDFNILDSVNSLGLIGMRERVGHLNGGIDFSINNKGGTDVIMILPVEAQLQ